ncbi:MAG: WD40 repeat domain-containing protein, partial [Isosphaeraceae bacterium]
MKGIKSLATVILMGIPAWVVLAGIFQFEPNSILIHVDEPGVTVWVDELPTKAESREVGPLAVKAGEYRVKVVRDGLPLFSRVVSVAPGEAVEVWAHWKAQESAAAARSVPRIPAETRAYQGHFGTVTGVSATEDGRRVISVAADGTLRVWDALSGEPRWNAPAHVGAVSGLTPLNDGRRVVTAGDDGLIRVWDVATGESLRQFHGGTDSALRCSAASPNGELVAIGLVSGLVQVFDLASGEELVRHGILPAAPTALAFSPDGRSLLVSMIGSVARDHRIEVWDARTGAVKRTLQGHSGPAWCVTVLPDGRRALSGGSDRTLRLWELESGRELARMTDHPGAVFCVGLSSDGRKAVAGTSHLWDGGGWTDAAS